MKKMAMLSSQSSPNQMKRSARAKKLWTDVQLKPLATLATKSKAARLVEFGSVLNALKINYPDAHCALVFSNPFELLIATILSAQCTDARVNIVTKELFKKFPDAHSMSEATINQLEVLIHSAGFYKNKAKNIKACCIQLVEKYKGEVPQTMEQLFELPGVGRKTANVVLGNAFGIASGVVVDTHVTRLANRLGWVKVVDAVQIETQLNGMAPQNEWVMLPHYLISHGRSICKARKPDCAICFLNSACPKRGV
jgi:endonuclease III